MLCEVVWKAYLWLLKGKELVGEMQIGLSDSIKISPT